MHKALINFQSIKNGYVQDKHHIYTWSEIDRHECFAIHENILNQYCTHLNNDLLVGRGSGYAPAFIRTGRIIEEALTHPELVTSY